MARKQKLLSRVAVAFGSILTAYLLIITALMPGLSPAKILCAVSAVMMFVISVFCRYNRFYERSAYAIIAITVVAGFAASLTNGGLEGYVTPILITAPIAAALFLSVRATIFTALSVVGCLCLQMIVNDFGLVKATAYSPDSVEFAALIMLTATTLICASGLAYFAQDSNKMITSLIEAQSELLAMSRKFERSAHHDALTGLANRKKLHAHIEQILSTDDAAHQRICVMHVDLDKFKEVNDTLGHPVGDGVLRNAANVMIGHFDDTALIARVGGDEFVIVKTLGENDTADHIKIDCECLIQRLRAPMSVNGVECQIDASIGFVCATRHCSQSETLISNADIALYEAKRGGGGIVHQFTAKMRERFDHRLETITDIETGLKQDWFICVMQPQICLTTGKITGLEALSRLHHPAKGILGTGKFIQLAEEIGVMDQIDRIAMLKAFSQLTELRALGYDIPNVSINVSAKTLRSLGYVDALMAAIKDNDLTCDDVIIEVLESILIEGDNDQAAHAIRQIRTLGMQVVIDDFGSGHATLGNLSRLEVDGLKIDRSLMPHKDYERSTKIVEAILTLAEGLGVPAVMEGIETEQQYEVMRALGCEYAQGFLFAKPLTMPHLIAWLDSYGKGGASLLQETTASQVKANFS